MLPLFLPISRESRTVRWKILPLFTLTESLKYTKQSTAQEGMDKPMKDALIPVTGISDSAHKNVDGHNVDKP